MSDEFNEIPALETPLYGLHLNLGARMVPFSGYSMPLSYPDGIMAEHRHTRAKAGLFDVSHMGQAHLFGTGSVVALEALCPADLDSLKVGQMRYSLLTNDTGGIRDDFMVTRLSQGPDGRLFLVVNAACKTDDFAHIRSQLPQGVTLEILENHALLALQGPAARDVMSDLASTSATLTFLNGAPMTVRATASKSIDCFVTRSGYTGEDGFEISVHQDDATVLAQILLSHDAVQPIGLGARDSLRLEAGLCLYGHDIDQRTTPVEASLTWAIPQRRRIRDAGYPGASVIADQISLKTVNRKRVGLTLEGRLPAREGAIILGDPDANGKEIGVVTSGGFAPTVGGPVAMGYVSSDHTAAGRKVGIRVRNRVITAQIASLPFVPQRVYRG